MATVPIVSNVAALRAIDIASGSYIDIAGYYADGDGGEGRFSWDTSTATGDNGGTIIVPSPNPTNGRWVRETLGGPISARWFGAKGDGIADDTTAIASAISTASGAALHFPTGEYLITSTLLLPVAGLSVTGDGQGSILKTTAPIYIFQGTDSNNFECRFLAFQGPDNNTVAIHALGHCLGWRIGHCTAINCALYNGATSASNYATASDSNSPGDIWIYWCRGYGNNTSIGTAQAFISLAYGTNIKISNCSAEYYAHGVQWWGGDSNPSVNGATTNPRKISDVEISHCRMWHVLGGGIWGSMGQNIRVIEPDVAYSADVGVDFEGCWESYASGGHIQDCANGCLTTFWYNRNVSFRGVDVTVSTGAYPVFRIYNASQNWDNESVSVCGGTWVCLSGTALADANSGPAKYLRVSSVKCRDVVLNFTTNNLYEIVVENCDLLFTTTMASIASAAIVGAQAHGAGDEGKVVISRNVIRSLASQPNVPRAIAVVGDDFNFPTFFDVNDNRTEGFSVDVICVWNGGNAGIKGHFSVRNNFLRSGNIDTSGLNGSAFLKLNNYGENLSPI